MKNNPVQSGTILTYHSQNVAGDWAPVNDHLALARDIAALHKAGAAIVSLDQLMHPQGAVSERPLVCLTFDDGCVLDVEDVEFPGAGLQRSFLGILQDFIAEYGDQAQPDLHATSFVIASAQARALIDERSLFGLGWMGDDWWSGANANPLMSIASHGWDHHHPDLDPGNAGLGDFARIDSESSCYQQVVEAGRVISDRAGQWPHWFAYPFGQSSAYLREEFLPGRIADHRCLGALGTDPGQVRVASNRWNLPRMVSGRDWFDSGELLGLLGLD